uniref:CHK kinase-like domain-containing protein n=2 Tax=Lutzomyia longipalpis TaxID=7200 RepID=A0A1B0C985_LUTLO
MDPEYPIYEWINRELCTKIVNSYVGKSCEITDLDIKYATRKGDNFTSALFRIKLTYSETGNAQVQELRFILKTPIQEEQHIEAVSEEFNIFKRESTVYGTILEKCYGLLREKGDMTVFGPRPLYVEEKLLAMEDLTAMNYNLMGRGKKLNRHQCHLVLSKLARWHATTAVLFEKEPKLFENHHVPNFSEETQHMHLLFTNILAAAMKHNRGAPELKNFTNKLAAFTAQVIPRMIGVFTRDPSGFSVL